MGENFDVIGFEDLIMDFAMQIDRIPKTDGLSVIKDSCWAGGGNASSAVVALSRLGASCAMMGCAGKDAYGDFCVEDMKKNGVDTSHLKQVEGETTLCVCLAETATQGRSFLGKMGTARRMKPEEVDESFLCKARILHISCMPTPAQQAAIDIAKKCGAKVSLDAGAFFPGADKLADQADLLIMSEDFYKGLFGEDTNYCENCRKLTAGGAQIAIVTLGKKGCAGADEKESFQLKAFEGSMPIVDTTGAGDVFHGGFLYAFLYRYKKEPYNYSLADCARFASAVSYINCGTLGGRPGIPTLDMVEAFLEDGVIIEGDIAERRAFYRDGIFQKKK